jgi:hypothetical protein
MQFGFSIPGVVFLAMLFAPNILWARHQPEGYAEISKVENRILLGIWCQSPITVAAAAILGVGHIGIYLGHLREISSH